MTGGLPEPRAPSPRAKVVVDDVIELHLEQQRRQIEGLLARIDERAEARRSAVLQRQPVAPPIEGQVLQIVYRAATGAGTCRRIRITRVREVDGLVYVDAFCMERQAPRMFRADRIGEVIDMASGEVFDGWQAWLASMFPAAVEPLRKIRQEPGWFWRMFEPAATVLMFVARIDGEVHRSEQIVVAELAYGLMTAHAATVDQAELGLVSRIARGLFPSREDCEAAIVQLDAGEKGAVATALDALIEADTVVDDREIEAVAAIKGWMAGR